MIDLADKKIKDTYYFVTISILLIILTMHATQSCVDLTLYRDVSPTLCCLIGSPYYMTHQKRHVNKHSDKHRSKILPHKSQMHHSLRHCKNSDCRYYCNREIHNKFKRSRDQSPSGTVQFIKFNPCMNSPLTYARRTLLFLYFLTA